MARNTVSRTLHDVGLAAWFGGTLANAVALNVAAGAVDEPAESGRIANVGWDRWTPVNLVAIGVHVVGSVGLLIGNRERLVAQRGVASMTAVKTALTAAALGVTSYSRMLGKKVSQYRDVPVESGAVPSQETPGEVSRAQRQLRILQWVVPAVTGVLVAVSAYAGEQQRPSEVRRGLKSRFLNQD